MSRARRRLGESEALPHFLPATVLSSPISFHPISHLEICSKAIHGHQGLASTGNLITDVCDPHKSTGSKVEYLVGWLFLRSSPNA